MVRIFPGSDPVFRAAVLEEAGGSSGQATIIEYPINAKRDRLADWLDEATAGRQDALEELRATPDGYRDWTEWESWLAVEDDRRAVIREEWSDPGPWAPPIEDD
jgi:hypothetical protein